MSYTKRYIAMCDILGFKEFIKETKLRDAVDKIKYFREQAIEKASESKTYEFSSNDQKVRIYKIPWAMFSDTLLMWVEADANNPDDIISVHLFFDCIGALIAYSTQHELPFRVGVSYGECYVDQNTNIYMGQPIIDAHLTEQNQQWIGGACHASCIGAPFFETVTRNVLVIPYEIPRKDIEKDLKMAIEWVSWAEVNMDDYLKNEITKASRQDIKIKYMNTMNFYSVVRPPASLLNT